MLDTGTNVENGLGIIRVHGHMIMIVDHGDVGACIRFPWCGVIFVIRWRRCVSRNVSPFRVLEKVSVEFTVL